MVAGQSTHPYETHFLVAVILQAMLKRQLGVTEVR
jgi:hypothetical protein